MSIEIPDWLESHREYLQSHMTKRQLEEFLILAEMINVNNCKFEVIYPDFKTDVAHFILFSWS